MWPAAPPPGYLGQLNPEFQRQLAGRWADVRLEDCYFYHSVLLPDGSFVQGPWDLIDNESEYLGGIDLAGRSVLEYGPASGWLTAWMAQQGAEVVIIDIGWDLSTDLIPLATFDLETTRQQQVAHASQIVNSWWYVRRAFGHSAKAVYAPVYDLPSDLGRYDVSTFGSILLHLRDPFMALQQAAAVTDDAIVVVEPLVVPADDVNRPVLFWNPSRQSANPNGGGCCRLASSPTCSPCWDSPTPRSATTGSTTSPRPTRSWRTRSRSSPWSPAGAEVEASPAGQSARCMRANAERLGSPSATAEPRPRRVSTFAGPGARPAATPMRPDPD